MKHTLVYLIALTLLTLSPLSITHADEGPAPQRSEKDSGPSVAKDAPAKDKPADAKKEADATKKDVIKSDAKIIFTIQLVDGSKLIGPPVNLRALDMKADFAPVSIPLHLIGYASMSKDHTALTIKFRNNDVLTGKPTFDKIVIRTAFGQAAVPVARIAKISITEPFK